MSAAAFNSRRQLQLDADRVQDVIHRDPGIKNTHIIATKTGLTRERVGYVIRAMQRGRVVCHRIDYGTAKPKGGQHAGKTVTGWFAMEDAECFRVMPQADERDAKCEFGYRRRRLMRVAQARDIQGAEVFVERMAEQLGLSIDAMSLSDLEAFEELLAEVAVA